MRYQGVCGNISSPMPVSFFQCLLLWSTFHMHTKIWTWPGNASVWAWELMAMFLSFQMTFSLVTAYIHIHLRYNTQCNPYCTITHFHYCYHKHTTHTHTHTHAHTHTKSSTHLPFFTSMILSSVNWGQTYPNSRAHVARDSKLQHSKQTYVISRTLGINIIQNH